MVAVAGVWPGCQIVELTWRFLQFFELFYNVCTEKLVCDNFVFPRTKFRKGVVQIVPDDFFADLWQQAERHTSQPQSIRDLLSVVGSRSVATTFPNFIHDADHWDKCFAHTRLYLLKLGVYDLGSLPHSLPNDIIGFGKRQVG